jgi:glycosyltransferase involved in cell wall biosynthesis
MRVGYVLKMYPRFSETFVVTELLAHERSGLDLRIFSLRAPSDGRFHECLARVRAPVTYLKSAGPKADDLWDSLRLAASEFPETWQVLHASPGVDARDAAQAVELALAVRTHGITHLHAHFASVSTTVARLAAALVRISYSITAHAKDIFHESVDPTVLDSKLAEAAFCVTVSEYNDCFLREKYGKSADGVKLIYNGLDLDEFRFVPGPRTGQNILAIGRLVEKKGFDVLIDACAELRRRGRSFTCEIVGSGAVESALRAQIERLGLGDFVQLSGPASRDQIVERIGSASVFAAPCVVGKDGNRDGLPTVLLEAMALGTPCVSTPVTGIPEIVHHDETGLLVPERDAIALADALDRLLSNPDCGRRLAVAARALMEDRFDIHSNTLRMRRAFSRAQAQLLPTQPGALA